MNKKNILHKLNIKDPYPYIKSLNLLPTPSPAWGGDANIFDRIITSVRPKIIVELGTFLGGSTITMAKSLKRNNIDGIILAVDTWLGSKENWIRTECDSLHLYDNFEFGISGLYNKFVTNVIYENMEDYIVPIPSTTDTAFDVLKNINILADVVYMDADHREDVVYKDLVKYSDILTTNGIMFGHDINWQPVLSGVTKYCIDYNKTFIKEIDNTNNRVKFWQIINK